MRLEDKTLGPLDRLKSGLGDDMFDVVADGFCFRRQRVPDWVTEGFEFRQQIETIVEGFLSMKNSISKERIQMEKLWKEREKQLEKVLLSTSGMYGSIKGIAGASIGEIPLLEDGIEEEPAPKLMFK